MHMVLVRMHSCALLLAFLSGHVLADSEASAEHPHIVPGQIEDTKKMKEELLSDLTSNFRRGHNEERLHMFQDVLEPMFSVLPKNAQGNIEHGEARYALHRIFVQRHGWTISGLEPSGDAAVDSVTKAGALMQWAPTFLVDAIEALFGTHGVNLRELAVLAATFEDLIHSEAAGRLDDIYTFLKLDKGKRIDATDSNKVVTYYMAMYTSGGNETVRTIKDIEAKRGGLDRRTRQWLKTVQREVAQGFSECDAETEECDELEFPAAVRVVEQIGEQYGPFNEELCQDLKGTLLRAEDGTSGRVKMADFYEVGLHGSWNFTETPEYLRDLGALDDTNGEQRVIIPNYVASRPNCLAASTIYMVCCRNECEDLLAHFEKQVQGASASAERLVDLAQQLPSVTIEAPWQATAEQRAALEAASEHGEVPLHGRAFAQWMHDAYPRECPRPHLPGEHVGPQTPDEWIREAPEPITEEQVEKDIKDVTVTAEEALGPAGPKGHAAGLTEEAAQRAPDQGWEHLEDMPIRFTDGFDGDQDRRLGAEAGFGLSLQLAVLFGACLTLVLLMAKRMTKSSRALNLPR